MEQYPIIPKSVPLRGADPEGKGAGLMLLGGLKPSPHTLDSPPPISLRPRISHLQLLCSVVSVTLLPALAYITPPQDAWAGTEKLLPWGLES